MPDKTPVTILTGFLGAGKTTFLNHLLQKNEHIRYAIIENEYGEEGIDNELVLRPDETIVELNSGCLCCTLNDNLYDILNELFERRDEFDEIIIEATGVADPAGIAEPFITHPSIKNQFPLAKIICLVDAEFVEEQIEETEEALNQIIFSDILLINKTDLVSESAVTLLENRLKALNPLAKIVKGNKEQFPLITYDLDEEELVALALQPEKKQEHTTEDLSFPIRKPHTHHHHHHTEEVISCTFRFDRPFHFHTLYQQLLVYLTFQSKGLYRIKGLVWLEGEEQQFLIQSVGRRLNFEEKRHWESNEPKGSILVFIGKNLHRQGIEKMLEKCLSSSVSTIE